ncbi:myosin heavy chain, non-muscle-like [Asterias rubens]|uniref:myosin heavy chain, non-muscle-like n=1 Tax=Asterias rubens TaxID=7604 RepID=UPI001454E7CB|nr:myosin heavy chain, non-muscle-like [Asterias rubens]
MSFEQNLLSDEVIKEREKEEIEMERSMNVVINDSRKFVRKNVDKLRNTGQEIFQIMNELAMQENQGSNAGGSDLKQAFSSLATQRQAAVKAKTKEAQEVLNERALLADSANWQAAAQEVKKALDDTLRMARTNNDRNMIKNALKQFNFMSVAVERRNQENMELCEQILELGLSTNHLNKLNEKLDVELIKKTTRLEALENFTEKKNVKIKELQEQLKAMKSTVDKAKEVKKPNPKEEAKREAAIKAAEKENARLLQEFKKFQTEAEGREEELHKEIELSQERLIDAEDTAVKLNKVIDNLEGQLGDTLEQLEEHAHQLDLTQFQSEAKQSQQTSMRDQYQQRIKEYKQEVEGMDKNITRLKDLVKVKEETIHLQETKMEELIANMKQQSTALSNVHAPPAKDVAPPSGASAEVRNMLSRVKGEHEVELHKLQEHFTKEKQRSDATMRKQENEMRIQLANILKESNRLLRAVNRFKDGLAAILEKEGLLDTAHEVRQLHNISIEEKPTDVKMILGQMAGNAVEVLVSLEIKIAQALMNKRLELKEALMPRQRTLTPLVEVDQEVEKLTKEIGYLTEKLEKAQELLHATEVMLSETRRINDEKYKALLDRHKALILHSSSLNREMKSLEQAFREEMKKRDTKLRFMRGSMAEQARQQQTLVTQLKMDMESNKRVEKAPPDISQLRLKVSDQLRNLSVLESALKENKISLELHTITVDIITQTMEVPEMRLRHMFERYITFRRLQEQKEELISKIDDTLTVEHDKKLQGFFARMETRMTENVNKWQEQREALKQERTNLYEQMLAIFDAVGQETGLTLARPVEKVAVFRRQRKNKAHPILGPQGIRMKVPMEFKSNKLIGTSVTLIGDHGPFWKMPSNMQGGADLVTVPKILEMDIDSRRKTAKEVLQRLGMGDIHKKEQPSSRPSQEPSVPPLATLFPPISS